MSVNVELEIDLPREPDMELLQQGLRRGVMLIGNLAQGLWRRWAQDLDVRRTGEYIRSIQAPNVDVGGFDSRGESWSATITVTNTAPHASIVEDGHGAFSLAQAINWSALGGRIKRTKDGRPYLHIPFQHSAFAAEAERVDKGLTRATVKAMMPQEVYLEAKKLRRREGLNVGPITRPRVIGHTRAGKPIVHQQFVAADRYHWTTKRGAHRLSRGTRPAFIMGGPGVSAGGPGEPGWSEHRSARYIGRDAQGNKLVNPAWKSSRFEGLMKTGPARHTKYLTIRTITPDSKGWNIPALAGKGVARHVAGLLGGPMRDKVNGILVDATLAALEGGRRR